MSSTTRSSEWEKRYADVVQRTQPSPDEAAAKLALARKNVARASARLAEGDTDQALINAETAIVNAADAVLARDGYRLRGKTASHQARFEYPGIARELSALKRTIEKARRMRNVAQYDHADTVSEHDAAEVRDAAVTLIRAVEKVIPTARPTPSPRPR